jgi:hypothetical protein
MRPFSQPLRLTALWRRRPIADNGRMSPRRIAATLSCAATLAVPVALATPAGAWAAHSVGTPGQIAWVRSAASRFVTAELAGSGASACGILDVSLRSSEHHRTCAQRWDTRLARMLREPGARARLRAQKRAIATAAVQVHGNLASIDLATPLMDGPNRFRWSENCWMLDG